MGNLSLRYLRCTRATMAISIVALSMATNAWAYRVLEQLEDAHELTLGQITLPRSETGSISFRTCETCADEFLNVTTATRYQRSGEIMTLSEFVAAVNEIRSLNSRTQPALIYVFFNVESKRVTRIELDQL